MRKSQTANQRRFRRIRLVASAVVAAGVAFAVARVTFAATVSDPVVSAGPPGFMDITWTVRPTATDDPIVDFHLLTGKWRPATATLLGPGGGADPNKWNRSTVTGGPQAKRGYHWNNPNKDDPVDADGFTFTIRVREGKFTMCLLEWKTTKDGDPNPEPDDGSGPDSEGTTPVPVKGTTTPTDDPEAPVGTTTTLGISSTEDSVAYEMVACSTITGAPDPVEDWTAFVAWAQANPVPPSWNLVVQGMTGNLDEDGQTTAPRVTVPNNAALIGNAFFIAAAARNEDDATDWVASEPRQITIVAAR